MAATALHHGLDFVTGNIRHYGRIPDLRIRPLRHAPCTAAARVGFVGPHGGILGVGDLDPRGVGWLHPDLEVSVER